MINFIICDSNKTFSNSTKEIINKIMIKENNDYKIHLYKDYSPDLNQIINDTSTANKIYILDLEIGEKSGIEIANEIRKNDFDSIIIFYSAHSEMYGILRIPLIFDYVSKIEPINLEYSLKNVLKYLKKKSLHLNNGNTVYNIKLDDILYISTDLENRGVIIVTDTEKINIKITLNNISKMLNSDFIKTHRACYVNKNRIYKVDFKNREIVFDNYETTNLVSIREIKKLKENI
ncbi:MAG: response regulator transcription factor [Bacilli bacterium]|nr:response regulator transcription factor [Bacilli bacterium]